MRFYSADEVHAALDYAALADAIAAVLKTNTGDGRRAAPSASRSRAGGGRATTGGEGIIAPLRQAHALSASDSLLLMPAWDGAGSGAIGVKLVTVMPGNRQRGAATVNSIYALFDRESGEPRAIIDGEALTLRRTAAASLLAARYLARSDAEHLLIVGTGRLARHLAHAHCAERAVKRLVVWGRNAQHGRGLASTLRAEGLPAEPAAELEPAVRIANIVSCATTSTAPLIRGEWLKPGAHVDLVGAFKRGMRESDDDAVARSRIYVDTYAGALAEADDIIQPIERAVIARSDVRAELAELVNGAAPGRSSVEDITLFKSVGAAFEDLAAARLVMERVL